MFHPNANTVLPESDTVILDRGYNTSVTVNLYGATVTSWRYRNQEQLFVGQKGYFNGKNQLFGGVQITFPQYKTWIFGPHHGFARLLKWNVEKPPQILDTRDVEAVFSVCDDEFTHAMWNYKFKLTLRLLLKERELVFDVTVENTNENFPFVFQFLFDNYLLVPDVLQCEISGLDGCFFIDHLCTCVVCPTQREDQERLTIKRRIDRIYKGTPHELTITNVMQKRNMTIKNKNFYDVVLWNPWKENAENMGKFLNGEYLEMMCFKVGNVSSCYRLLPKCAFEGQQTLQISPHITSKLYSCI